jgi:hypothetical protein
VHKGKILKTAVKDSGMSVDTIMKRLGYASRNTYYYHIQQANLPTQVLNDYGKIIKHDFSNDIEGFTLSAVAEEESPYFTPPKTMEEAIKQRDFYVKLYIKQLEDYRKLQDELAELKQQQVKK